MGAKETVEAIRAKREAQYAEALGILSRSLHEKFCDADQKCGPWDESVVEHVVAAYETLPLHLHSAVLSTIALRQARGGGR